MKTETVVLGHTDRLEIEALRAAHRQLDQYHSGGLTNMPLGQGEYAGIDQSYDRWVVRAFDNGEKGVAMRCARFPVTCLGAQFLGTPPALSD
jgi:hypothetical protein